MSIGEIVVTIVCSILGSGVISSLIAAYSASKERKLMKKEKEEMRDDSVKKAVMFSLLYVIQSEGRRLLTKEDPITLLEYKQFSDMYNAYKAIGGDGYADLYKSQVDQKFSESSGSDIL